jgi:hypothetical protein
MDKRPGNRRGRHGSTGAAMREEREKKRKVKGELAMIEGSLAAIERERQQERDRLLFVIRRLLVLSELRLRALAGPSEFFDALDTAVQQSDLEFTNFAVTFLADD